MPVGTARFEGKFDAGTGKLTGTVTSDDGMTFAMDVTVKGTSMEGTLTAAGGAMVDGASRESPGG